MRKAPAACRDFLRTEALTRRELLRVGGLGFPGLSLPHLFATEANGSDYLGERPPARAKSCILLFLPGAPSCQETFDPKPDAPTESRTIFNTIQTKVPGTNLCEYLGDLAALADKFALVRSVGHKYNGHFGGHRYALTGFPAVGNADQAARPDDRPGILSLAAKHVPARSAFPKAVMLPWLATDQGSGASGGMYAGTLGKQFNPLLVEADPNQAAGKKVSGPFFRVPEITLNANLTTQRFEDRRGLLEDIERQRGHLQQAASAAEMNDLYRKAYDLLASPKIREGFEIEQEPAKLREKYGMNAFGQSCLLGRRMVERGARFVQVNFCRFVTQNGYGWDTHNKGRETLKDHLLPKLNAGVASLLSDLDERGLLKETLVVAMGEFGRTPKVKPDGGRDHWSSCYSILLAGGGIRGGLVYGKSDKAGAYPVADAVDPRDVLVTILTLLGVPNFANDAFGRAAPLFENANAIARLYG
jgi:hypothetical protein